MKEASKERNRLSIDVSPELHRRIKILATTHDKTIREYVLETLEERLRQEEEARQLVAMTANVGPVFEELWDNEKDAYYDNL